MQRKVQSILLGAALALVAVTVCGCRGRGFFAPKGPMNEQQARAVVHDPFPQNDIAPFEAASRPPEYQTPLPEPVRTQLVPDAMPWLKKHHGLR